MRRRRHPTTLPPSPQRRVRILLGRVQACPAALERGMTPAARSVGTDTTDRLAEAGALTERLVKALGLSAP